MGDKVKDDEPHAVEDNEPEGEQAISKTTVRLFKRRKLIIHVSFDDTFREFELWNYIYDLRDTNPTDMEFETIPDYENRIQTYKVSADRITINKLRIFLIKNKFDYKVDKK